MYKLSQLALVLTWCPEEEQHSDPVDPEEHEADESPKRLYSQQGKVDKHFTSNMEQGNGEGHTLPHYEHHYQEDHLEGCAKSQSLSITEFICLGNYETTIK